MTAPSAGYSWASTLRARAEVLLVGGRVLSGDLHLQPLASHHSGPETPEDLLNRAEGFFPLTEAGGTTLLVSKPQVICVEITVSVPQEDADRVTAARHVGLHLELSDGSVRAGSVRSEMPPDRPRALDFLNEGPGFFALYAAEAVRFINRAHVRLATPLD